ncbi:RDD family protein [Granulicella sp. WH15]|uniref:RDD family protein n=1 Tax=Granulicella sp. WH15 TaxID=2602070 RepID=UPI001366FA83|nr:RDD family protein [Granulicella sp. WH15]QHN03173.1 RDD family protein [Granulicella sp. WH15]
MLRTRYFRAHEPARYDALDGLPLASFWSRAAAILIDLGILLLLRLPFSHLGAHANQVLDPTSWPSILHGAAEKAKELLESVLYFAIALKLGKGRTPGKWIMRIRVLSLSHDEIGWWQSIERGLGYGASLLEGGFGFVQYFINRNRMCVHDRIAETIVVDTTKEAQRTTD